MNPVLKEKIAEARARYCDSRVTSGRGAWIVRDQEAVKVIASIEITGAISESNDDITKIRKRRTNFQLCILLTYASRNIEMKFLDSIT